jgi:NADPH-dependent 2,4-dienoyl-CoA reductase/sulfur reductase-like enzyme
MITDLAVHLDDRYDVLVVGAGPAGLAAAVGARNAGAERVLIVDRERQAGGILLQCIHSGFGLHAFKEDITGPEYAERYLERVLEADVDVLEDAFVMDVDHSGNGAAGHRIKLMSPAVGVRIVEAGSIVLAMGARERTRGAIHIPGDRPSGVLTAGLAQKMVNLHGFLPGRRVVILGSGDIGLIMARRLTLEGCEVVGVFEIMPHANGLGRNIVQCLEDFDIPLHLSTTVVDVHGHDRLQRVTIAPVDDNLQPVMAKAWDIDCDTLLLSIGLIPENELSRRFGMRMDPLTNGPMVTSTFETTTPGVFAAGNVVHINDLADWVTEEALIAGRSAGQFVTGSMPPADNVRLVPGENVAQVVPHTLATDRDHTVYVRVRKPIYDKTTIKLGSLYRRKVNAVVPSEMVTLKLRSQMVADFHGDALTVHAVPTAVDDARGGTA